MNSNKVKTYMIEQIPENLKQAFFMAKEASESAYAPYSGFKVGAAVLTRSDKIFTGCNIENSSYGATICAERVAICKAVSENSMDFHSIAIYIKSARPFPPCGICRQFIAEFSDNIIVAYGNDEVVHVSDIMHLLQDSFRL